MPRYALLRHECPPDYRDGPHWDLMLERAGTTTERRLATWSLLDLPGAWRAPGVSRGSEPPLHLSLKEVAAVALEDHRAAYLSYEGSLSGGRGEVTRLASGALEWIEASDTLVRVRLLDGPLVGLSTLERHEDNRWSLSVKGEC